jgi:hypothetical protein
MAPITFSGTIPSKKKADLQAIAVALDISDAGTKEDLQGRIKRHLERHQSKYEDDPTFSGLYGKRKRSAQPPITSVTSLLSLSPSCSSQALRPWFTR